MTKIPSDDILEGLYKLRIRESEKLKTVLELYNMEIHQKKAGPNYRRLMKTMVKRSIEQDLRNRNFGARNGNCETSAVVRNQRVKQRGQRTLGDCWQWEASGQCSKGDNCSFRHDMNKRGKVTPSNPSPSSFMQQNERNASRTRSPRGKVSMALQGLPQRNLHQFILRKMVPSRILVLQVQEWLPKPTKTQKQIKRKPRWNGETRYMPKEETFTIPLKYIDVTRTSYTFLDVLSEKY